MRTGVNEFNPDRLKSARMGRGLNKSALADLVERSAATITKWENGSQRPEIESLRMISDKLNFPLAWFTQSEGTSTASTRRFFRSLSSTSRLNRERFGQRLNWLNEITTVLQSEVELPKINIISSEKHFLALSDEDISLIASRLRDKWNLGLGPIDNLFLAMESAGIVCSREEVGDSKMDGISAWYESDNRPYMIVSSDKGNAYRTRFDAAHELGHVVMHRNITESEFKQNFRRIEEQANYFAGEFLLPTESFSASVDRTDLNSFSLLKERWKVSIAAMLYRSKQLNLISEEHSVRLWKNYSARGWRKGEPGDNFVPVEELYLLPSTIKLLLNEGIVTKDGLVSWLKFCPNDIQKLCGLKEEFFLDNKQLNLKVKKVIPFPRKAQ